MSILSVLFFIPFCRFLGNNRFGGERFPAEEGGDCFSCCVTSIVWKSYHLSSACQVAHRASTEAFHFCLSTATPRPSSHEPHPPSFISLSTVVQGSLFYTTCAHSSFLSSPVTLSARVLPFGFDSRASSCICCEVQSWCLLRSRITEMLLLLVSVIITFL